MPRKFEKKNADHFEVVHRSQRDASLHSEDSQVSERILKPLKGGESVRTRLPSEVLPSRKEIPVEPIRSLFVEMDPEIVAHLEGESGFATDDEENWLDDNFIEQANAKEDSVEEDSDFQDEYDEEEPFEDEEDMPPPELHPIRGPMDPNRELLEQRFTHLMKQYDDDDEEESEREDEDAEISSKSQLQTVLEQYQAEKKLLAPPELVSPAIKAELNRTLTLQRVEESDSDPEELIHIQDNIPWDCQSFHSTYSTYDNHPKLIAEPKTEKKIRLSNKTGLPLDVLPTRERKAKEGGENKGVSRRGNETAEEKKERKKKIKEEKKANRQEKKAFKEAFKAEELHLQRVYRPSASVIKL